LISYSGNSCFLTYYSYCRHRDLDPFPTRRSSDLFSHPFLGNGNVRNRKDKQNDKAENSKVNHPSVPVHGTAVSDCNPAVGTDSVDRKSTRLNSSHGSTSYAASCLKKTTSTTAGTE